MNFSSEQIAPGKWGIYSDAKLLATVSSEAICKTVIANLASGRKDLPTQDVNALYQISSELKPPLVAPAHASSSTAVSSSSDTSSIEEALASLNEQQLEDALIRAQQRSIKDAFEVKAGGKTQRSPRTISQLSAKAVVGQRQQPSAQKMQDSSVSAVEDSSVKSSQVKSSKSKSGKSKSGKSKSGKMKASQMKSGQMKSGKVNSGNTNPTKSKSSNTNLITVKSSKVSSATASSATASSAS